MENNFVAQSEPVIPGLVIIALGTSTAGKSTVCAEVLKRNAELPQDQQLDWQIEGHDVYVNKFNPAGQTDARCYAELKESNAMKEIQRLQPRFLETTAPVGEKPAIRELIIAVRNGKLFAEGRSIDLLNRDNFNEQLGEFLKATKDFYGKEMLEQLQLLAAEKQGAIDGVIKEQEKFDADYAIFDAVIKNSKEGKPTLLDLVPMRDGQDLSQKFKDYCQQQGFECEVHTALIHSSVKELVGRMEARNQEALAKGDRANIRNTFFTFSHYANLFEPAANKRNCGIFI